MHLNFTFNNQKRNAFICNLLATHRWICISLIGCTAPTTRFFSSCSKVLKLIYFAVLRGRSKRTHFFFFIPKHYFSIVFYVNALNGHFWQLHSVALFAVSRAWHKVLKWHSLTCDAQVKRSSTLKKKKKQLETMFFFSFHARVYVFHSKNKFYVNSLTLLNN